MVSQIPLSSTELLSPKILSAHAVEERLSTCVHLESVCPQTRFHTQKRQAGDVWIWWSRKVRMTVSRLVPSRLTSRQYRSMAHHCRKGESAEHHGQFRADLSHSQTKTLHPVYLSEETHFDCILGRSFMEARSVKTDVADPTSVMCLDTGEKVDCELVVIRDGNGEIVTVT